jgi:Holliday junction resolvasome RuvABC endonuclease subunit
LEKKKNNAILGLDVSTSTIGFSLFDLTSKLISIGYVELSKIKVVYQKATEFKNFIIEILQQFNLIQIIIEAPLLRFSKFSSADTLNKLAAFNGIISYLMFNLTGVVPEHIHASTARKLVCGKLAQKNVKEQVFNYVRDNELNQLRDC